MAKKWAERSGGTKAFVVIFWAFVGLIIVSSILREDPESTAEAAAAEPASCSDQQINWRAPIRAEAYVKERLVSRGSAKFGQATTYLMPSNDEGICLYTVTGTVDADNRLGVSIRHEYAAKVRYDIPSDTWSEVDVAVAE